MSARETSSMGGTARDPTGPNVAGRFIDAVRRNAWQTAALVTVVVICLTLIAQGQAPTAQAQPPTADLVGYWSLNEGAGLAAADSSGFGHNGTLTSGPSWVAGKSGTALAFSGTSYVAVGDIPQIRALGAVTLSAWMKRGSTGAKVLVGKQTSGHDLAIEAWGDGRVYFDVSNGSYADGYILLNDTAWHHYTLVFNGQLTGNSGRLMAYVDGAQRTLTYDGTIP